MKISDAEQRINASYNTIKKFIEKESSYNTKINSVLHVTDLGLEQLEKEYGIRSEILSDNNIDFYKNQILFLRQQLVENKEYNNLFVKQIETKDFEDKKNKDLIKRLEEQLHQHEIQKLELKHELELEKNKSIWKKIFNKKESNND